MKHRYHTWRRVPAIQVARKDTFYCNHPSCFKKSKLSTLDKKFAECPNCGNTFVLDISTVTPEMDVINCPKCIGVEPNAETKQFEVIKEETTNFLEENFKIVKAELSKKQLELEKREKAILRKEEKLELQAASLKRIVDSHRVSFSRRRHNLKDLAEHLLQRERDLHEREQVREVDKEAIATALTQLFKKMEDNPNECNGLATTES